MFCKSARVSPCNAPAIFPESVCSTRARPFSSLITRPSRNSRVSSPLGPFTATVRPDTLTSTPFGMEMGFLPTRDIVTSPDRGDQLAAQPATYCFLPGQNAVRRGQDRRSQPAQYARNLVPFHVHPAAGG